MSRGRKNQNVVAQMNAFANTASAPDNSIDISADLIATGKQFWDPVCSQFESMGKMNAMPAELEQFMTRREYAAKFEQFNEAIEMEAASYKKWQKWCYGLVCPFFIIPCCIWGGLACRQTRLGKMADRVKYHSKVIFDDWKDKGIEITFIPGKKASAGGNSMDMYDTPNIIRILFPPGTLPPAPVVNATDAAPAIVAAPVPVITTECQRQFVFNNFNDNNFNDNL